MQGLDAVEEINRLTSQFIRRQESATERSATAGSGTEPATRQRTRAPREERRAQVLAAALGCFAAKGFHAATMDDLGRAAGLSKGSLYWHFESKEAVFLALFDEFAAEFFADWDALAAGDAPALDVLRAVGEKAVAELGSQGALLRAWIEFFSHPQARERLASVYARSRAKIAAALRRDIARGAIRDVPPEGAAAALIAAIEGLFLQAMVDANFDVRRHWPALWDVVSRGIRP